MRVNRKLVVVETPYAGNIERNLKYARLCMRDCISRGEAPIASHLVYTQEHILNDDDPDERGLGIELGFNWGQYADLVAFYVDLDWSPGMLAAKSFYTGYVHLTEERKLPSHLMLKMFE